MQNDILDLFHRYPHFAVLFSIFISILVAILGLVPSVFITAANILFFGFWNGTLISFAGEASGAAVAFLLYRSGFKKVSQQHLDKFPTLKKLVSSEGKEAFYLIFLLRLIPFVPSGLITFAAAIGTVRFIVFLVASSLGKLPALLLEAYSVYQVSEFNWQGKVILACVAVGLLIALVKNLRKKKSDH